MKDYQENVKKYQAKIVRLTKVLNRISLLRLLIFVISSIILITLFINRLFVPVFVVFPILTLCFAFVLRHHHKIAYLKKHTSFLKSINESEILRKKCDLQEFDTGHEFRNQNHPYTSDLDVFGQHSIFQLVNRTTTESGTILLAKWLSEPASKTEILDRQHAIKELSRKLDWRQDFQAAGMHYQNKKSDDQKLVAWVEAPVVLLKNKIIYQVVAITLSTLLLLGLFFLLSNLESASRVGYFTFTVLILMVNIGILRYLKPMADEMVEHAEKNLNTLRAYRALIKKMEAENFDSKKLKELKTLLLKNNYSACNEIKKMTRLLEFSEQRGVKKRPIGGNHFYPILNSFLLLDFYLIIGTEKWKSRNKRSLLYWSAIISEFEVLNSFAGFYHSNPSYTFPEITEKNNYVHFESLGHPLINSKKRVCNHFHSDGPGEVVMITGSNMGGKSTFLRTVGVNLVLALAGAPCCAKYGQVSNLKLYTSMRTQDNLKEGVSSFYAELDRIEKMLKLIMNSHHVFFLLDEMFKGTNSEDRHKGGFSLINQIRKLPASGIIATHDIELAKLSENRKLVANYSFNSEINDKSMIFSYKLHPGICNDFNASELMKRSGIDILSDLSKSETESNINTAYKH